MIEKVRMFLAVVTEKGVSKAADVLHVTQPAVSQGVRELENMLGVVLFERKGRQLKLTKNGSRFLPYAQQLIEKHDTALHLFKASNFTLAVGSSMTVASHLLLDVVEQFETHTSSKLELYVNNIETIHEMINNNVVDVAFIEGAANSTEYIFYPLGNFELEFVATPHYLAGKHKKIEELSFLTREVGSTYRMHFDTFCKKKGLLLTPKLESVHNELLKEAVLRHQGLALLPKELISDLLHLGKLETVPLNDYQLTEPYGLIVNRLRTGEPKISMFVEFILSHFKQENVVE